MAGISFIAGTAVSTGNLDGKGREAYFNRPAAIALNADGTLWVADTGNFTVRKVKPDGTVTTIAGSAGNSGPVDGIGAAARFSFPQDIAAAADGSAYVIDGGALRRVAANGTVTTEVGTPASPGGFGFPAAGAPIASSLSIAPDGSFYLASRTAIYRWSAGGGSVLVAGQEGVQASVNGPVASAKFLQISDIAVDAQRNIYVAEPDTHQVRKVDAAGNVTTFAGFEMGHADGIGAAARFVSPTVLSLDPDGNLWVGERGFGSFRKVTPAGNVTTPFGTPLFDFDATNSMAAGPAGDVWFGIGLGISRLNAAGVLTPVAGQDYVPEKPLANVAGMGFDASGSLLLAQATSTPGSFSSAFQLSRLAAQRQLQVFADLPLSYQSTEGFGFGPDGSVYVGAATVNSVNINVDIPAGGSITRIAPDGTRSTLASWTSASPDRMSPGYLTVGRDGAIYFVDLFTRNIVRYTTAGATVLGQVTLTLLAFQPPIILAADAAGHCYLLSRTAVYRAENGTVTLVAGHPTDAGVADGAGAAARFAQARSLAIDRDNNVYIGDGETVRRMTPQGVVTTVAGQRGVVGLRSGPLPASLGTVGRIAAADDGSLYVVSGGALVKIRLQSN